LAQIQSNTKDKKMSSKISKFADGFKIPDDMNKRQDNNKK
jgi:hypothetical protein